MIDIAPGYGPPDHRSQILKHSPGGYRRIGLAINHSGYVSAMQFPYWNMPDDW
jgi:hypothetical protein